MRELLHHAALSGRVVRQGGATARGIDGDCGQQILQLARDQAEAIIAEDPDLQLEKNWLFAKYVKKGNPQKIDWGSIS